MTAGIHNFVCERGAEFKRKISWVDVEGEPIDLSDPDLWIAMQVRKTFGDDPPLISLTSDDGRTWRGTPGFFKELDDQITLYIDAETTKYFEPGIYVYDITVGIDVDPGALLSQERYIRLMQGQFTVNDWVTDPRWDV